MSNDFSTNTEINIELIITRRKREWMQEARKGISIQERVASSVPWWLIIVALGLFALSAPHTAGMLSKMTPILGLVAPFVVEFGLLYAAFVRVKSKQDQHHLTAALVILEVLLFVLAIAVNGAGALTAVTEASSIANLSFEQLRLGFDKLPVTTQVALCLVPLFALLIPIGARVAGEGLAQLFLERRRTGGLLEERWREVEGEEIRRSLYAEFIRHMDKVEAKKQAEQLASGWTRKRFQAMSVQVQLPASSEITRPMPTGMAEPVRLASPSRNGRRNDARIVVRAYLEQNPDAVRLSARDLAKRVGVGKTIAHEEKIRYMADSGMIVSDE